MPNIFPSAAGVEKMRAMIKTSASNTCYTIEYGIYYSTSFLPRLSSNVHLLVKPGHSAVYPLLLLPIVLSLFWHTF